MGLNFKEKMAKAKADAQSGGNYENLPVDTYNMQLTQAFVNQSKGKRNQTNFDWKVLEGEYADKTHRSFDNLDHEVGLAIFVQNMEKMGVDASECESLEDIDAMVKNIASKGPIFTITIFEKKGYVNTKLVEFLGYAEEGEDVPDAQAQAEAPSEPETPSIGIGSSVQYKVDDKVITGTIKEIDFENETLDFAFHKGIPLADVVQG